VAHWDGAAAILGTHISFMVVVFLFTNAFYEELIVRAYLMSEIISWKRSTLLAGVVSVGIQSLYHIYQGVPNMISIAALFSVYAIYYAKSRRILPVILAHLYVDIASTAYLFYHH
jgi:membrane protease YdiL (CAAX protease family)